MSKGRVLVTGGAGFIGSSIVDALIAGGYDPFVVDNLSTGRRENIPDDVPLFEVDICDRSRLTKVFDEVQPRFVLHQAAQMSVTKSMREPSYDAEVNVLGLVQVLEQSVRTGAERLVFASSGGVLYGDVFEPATEDHLLNPVSPYGISKWVGERYVEFFARERGLKTVVLRYANVYGPRQNAHGEAGVVAIFSRRLLNGECPVIFGDGRNIRDYIYVTDVAAANMAALQSTCNERFVPLNIGTGIATDVRSLECQIRRQVAALVECASSARELPAVRYEAARPGDLQSNLVSSNRAQTVLGWKPQVDLATGLRLTVEWFATASGMGTESGQLTLATGGSRG